MKKISFLLIFLGAFTSFGQNVRIIDSLKKELGLSIKKDILTYYLIGREYKNIGNYKNALSFLKEGLKFNTDSLTNERKLSYHQELADVLLNQKKNDLALKHINLSDSIYNLIKKPTNVNHPYNLKCIILRRMGDYKGAIKSGIKSLEIAKSKKNYALVSVSYNSIGVLQEKLNNNAKAEKYYLKGIEAIKKDTFYSTTIHNNLNGNLYMNLANSLMNQNKNKEALLNYKKAKYYFNLLNNQHRLSYVYNNISYLKNLEKQYDSAIYYANKSLTIKLQSKSKKDLITNYLNLSRGYRGLKKPKKAYTNARLQIDILKHNKVESNNKLESYLEISKSLKMYDRYKLSLKYLNKYITLKDSILNFENVNQINNLEIKYQTQQKETKILALQNENIKKEARLTKSRYTIYSVLSALLIVLISTYFIRNKRKQEQILALLENTVKTSEQEKQRIGKELHDGIAGSIIKLVYETEGTQLDISDKLLKTYNEVRTLSHQLDNTKMHNELFLDRVLELIPNKLKDNVFSFSIQPNHLKLEEPYGTHIYRIIQELITNNLKYAKANKTTFKLTKREKTIAFVYIDDGVGIKKFIKGNGFKNIEDRIKLMNGKFNLNLKKKEGIEITFIVPYNPKAKSL